MVFIVCKTSRTHVYVDDYVLAGNSDESESRLLTPEVICTAQSEK